MSHTVGDRVFDVRKALGTRRRPMSQAAFARLLTAQGGRTYYGSEFTLIETNEKRLMLDDIVAIAAVDPGRRGKLWLAWGETTDATMGAPETPADLRSEELKHGSATSPDETLEVFPHRLAQEEVDAAVAKATAMQKAGKGRPKGRGSSRG